MNQSQIQRPRSSSRCLCSLPGHVVQAGDQRAADFLTQSDSSKHPGESLAKIELLKAAGDFLLLLATFVAVLELFSDVYAVICTTARALSSKPVRPAHRLLRHRSRHLGGDVNNPENYQTIDVIEECNLFKSVKSR